MPFPTVTDLAFYQARNQPRWAARIRKNYNQPSLGAPNIDHVVNAHAGLRITSLDSHNLMVFIRGWSNSGEDVLARLLEFAHLTSTQNKKRAALAIKWATRIARAGQ